MNVKALRLGPLGTNCYIVYGEDKKAAVIDPAFYADRIFGAIKAEGLVLDKILLTHAHFDHIMAVESLREKGAEVYVHFMEEDMLYDPGLNCSFLFTGREYSVKPPVHLLNDGDVVNIGSDNLRVLHTPGHTKGSVCYISREYIFSGDTLFKDGVGRWDLPGGDYNELTASLNKLNMLENDRKVFAGHGDQTTLYREKTDNIYMKNLR